MSKNKGMKTSIRKAAAAGAIMSVSMVALIGMTDAAAGPAQQTTEDLLQVETISPDAVREQDQDPVIHILEETASDPVQDTETKDATGQQAKEYEDIDFAALPVDMDPADQKTVFGICQDRGVAFPLVMAIIEQESQFDASATSTTGDVGYMQINKINRDTLFDMGYTDLFLLEDNVGAGVYMLSDLFSKYPGDTTFVLMAYNAGEKGAKKQRAAGIYETEYTKEILSRADDFSAYIDNALDK